VLCLTAVHDPPSVAKTLGVECLQKPIDLDVLLDRVKAICGDGNSPPDALGAGRDLL